MVSRRLGGLLLLACLGSSVRAQTTQPLDPEKQRQEDLREIQAETDRLPQLGTFDMQQVVKLTFDDGFINATTSLPNTPVLSRLQVRDMPGFSRVSTGMIGPRGLHSLQFENYDFSRPGNITVHTQIISSPGYLQIARDTESLGEQTSTSLIETRIGAGDEGIVKFHVQHTPMYGNTKAVTIHRTATSVLELRRLYPRDVSKYLQPIFIDLQQLTDVFGVGPRVAWQVFADEFKPNARLEAQLNSVLVRFDAEDYHERKAAATDLRKLGQPAALALMHADRSAFTPEQSTAVDTFLAEYRPLRPEDVDAMRNDPAFLIDCLNVDDAALRAIAFGHLKNASGKPLKFDPDASPETRKTEIAQIRSQLLGPTTAPSTAPTTQASTTMPASP